MIRDILRTMGISCILTGTFLFFNNTDKEPLTNDTSQQTQQLQIKELEAKLSSTQSELSKLQTATSAVQKSEAENVEEEKDTESETIVKTLFTIQPGTDSTTVSSALLRQGIIKDRTVFETYLTTENLSGKIQIGEYELDSTMDIKTIANLITK